MVMEVRIVVNCWRGGINWEGMYFLGIILYLELRGGYKNKYKFKNYA